MVLCTLPDLPSNIQIKLPFKEQNSGSEYKDRFEYWQQVKLCIPFPEF
jgi:hypothetical protein